MCFGQVAVQLDRFARGGERFWHVILGRSAGIDGQDGVNVGQTCVSQRVVRIEIDRLLKVITRLAQTRRVAPIPEVAAFQV